MSIRCEIQGLDLGHTVGFLRYCHQKPKAHRDTLGPVVDGSFVPELPGLLLLHNRFDGDINIMIGHNGDEGLGFPFISNSSAFEGMFGLRSIYTYPFSTDR